MLIFIYLLRVSCIEPMLTHIFNFAPQLIFNGRSLTHIRIRVARNVEKFEFCNAFQHYDRNDYVTLYCLKFSSEVNVSNSLIFYIHPTRDSCFLVYVRIPWLIWNCDLSLTIQMCPSHSMAQFFYYRNWNSSFIPRFKANLTWICWIIDLKLNVLNMSHRFE